jgi:chromosome segregation ATPase
MFDTIDPFGNNGEQSAIETIDELEETLKSALERRIEVRRDLKQKLREAKIQRSRAERRMSNSSSDIELAAGAVDAKDEVIEAYRSRIKSLNEQITAIRKRMPTLEVLRTDVELLRELETDSDWRSQIDALLDELNADDPMSGSTADAQLETLLTSIDDMVADASSATEAQAHGLVIESQETVESDDATASQSGHSGGIGTEDE